MTMTQAQALCDPEDVIIANGASLSAAINLNGRVLTAIYMPAAWTAASLSFRASQDGVTFYDLFPLGVEYVSAAAASIFIPLDNNNFLGVKWLKVRSGTAASPVNQGAARTLTLMAGVPAKAQ